jgi:hypothetical protein
MCRRVQCEQCQKVTYAGCGRHLEQVFCGVADTERCRCRDVADSLASSAALVQAASAATVVSAPHSVSRPGLV